MRVRLRAAWAPKAGSADSEYEDAFSPEDETFYSAPIFRCAVADGATETSFSREWAESLVHAYVAGSLNRRRRALTLEGLRRQWLERVTQRPLPWYAEAKVEDGAFAALLGVTLRHADTGNVVLLAEAVGDCCLLQVRDERIVTAFPIASPDGFTSRPYLLSSRAVSRQDRWKSLRTVVQPEDRLFLATDALAYSLLRLAAVGEPAWDDMVESCADEEQFRAWVGHLRDVGVMRNDDVTVLLVECDNDVMANASGL